MFKCPNCRNTVSETNIRCGICGEYLDKFVNIYRQAQNGDTDSQIMLGSLYRSGVYVEFNPKKGFDWTKRAAEKGNSHAKYGVACCYMDGIGVEKNSVRAIYWLLEAKKSGDADAKAYLQQLGIIDGSFLNEDTPLFIQQL